MLLKNQEITEEIKEEIKTYLEKYKICQIFENLKEVIPL